MADTAFVIRGARVFGVPAAGGGDACGTADVVVAAGRIEAVAPAGTGAPRQGGESIDAAGLLLLPGLIDDHVHFREPGREEKEDFATGSRASAHGGATTVFEIQNNAPLMSDRAALEAKLALVRGKSVVNAGVFANANAASLPHLGEMADLAVGFKVFLAPSHGDPGVDADHVLRGIFEIARRHDVLVVVHAEDRATIEQGLKLHAGGGPAAWSRARPAAAEVKAVERAIHLAETTGARIHVFHLSSAGAVDLVAEAKARGLPVTAATCPHYLLFTDQDVARIGGLLKVNPSIKGTIDRERLRDGVRDGTIDVIETDHAPHLPAEKRADFQDNPSGISGADVFLPLLFRLVGEGVLTLETLVERACRAPARLYRLHGKGRIEAGADADLVLVDDHGPDAAWSPVEADFLSKARVSPYVGYPLPARVVRTFVAGRTVYAVPDVLP